MTPITRALQHRQKRVDLTRNRVWLEKDCARLQNNGALLTRYRVDLTRYRVMLKKASRGPDAVSRVVGRRLRDFAKQWRIGDAVSRDVEKSIAWT